jgi:hypothetical protein
MSPLFKLELRRQISDCGIVAVLILDRVQEAVSVAQSLVAGGVTVMELTLRTPVALDALKAVRAEVPEMIAGNDPDARSSRAGRRIRSAIRRRSRSESEGPRGGPRRRPLLCSRRGDTE